MPRLAAVTVAGMMAAIGVAAQESPGGEDDAAQSGPPGETAAGTVAPTAEDDAEAGAPAEPTSGLPEVPLPDAGETEGPARERLYLGPIPVVPDDVPEASAARPPTSILVGPYIPEGAIALPDLSEEDARDDVAAASEAGSAEPGDADAADAALAADIAVDPLTELEPAAVGAWREGRGEPFPVDMWEGSRRAVIEALIPRLPMTVRSPVMQALARRLLLSPARLPGSRPPPQTRAEEAAAAGGSGALPAAGPRAAAVEPASADDGAAMAAASGNPERLAEQPDDPQASGAGGLPPPGATAEDDPDGDGGDLLYHRLERLAAGGALDDLLALAERIPEGVRTERIERLRSDALLILGDYAAACRIADSMVAESGAAYWLRALAMCEALQGNRSAVYFRLGLLEEAGEASDAFSALVEALLSEIEGATPDRPEGVLEHAERLDPVLFALARLTRAEVPVRLAETAEPLVIGGLVELPDLAPEVHLAVGERAVSMGMLRGETLREIYVSVSFTEEGLAAAEVALRRARQRTAEAGEPDAAAIAGDAEPDGEEGENGPEAEPDSPVGETIDPEPASGATDAADASESTGDEQPAGTAQPPAPSGLRLDALLYQRAAAASGAERLRWIERLLRRGREEGRAFAVAEAAAGLVAGLQPSDEIVGFAGTAGRSLLLAGRIEQALAWYRTAREASERGVAGARAALVELWPLMVVTDRSGTVPYSPQMARLWWQGRSTLPESERLARGDRLFALLGELGREVPRGLRDAVLAAPQARAAAPPSLLWRQLIIAAMDERLGESVLSALAAVGDGGPQQAAPALLATAVGALKAVGLEGEARRFALETLVAGGF